MGFTAALVCLRSVDPLDWSLGRPVMCDIGATAAINEVSDHRLWCDTAT